MLAAGCGRKPSFTGMPSSQTGITFQNNVSDKPGFNIFDYPYLYAGGGVAVGDINGDGLDDVFFTANQKGGNKLYLNKGAFHFEDITDKAGVAGLSDWCTGATMVDINGDGLLDIYVSTVSIPGKLQGRNELYINKGNNTFKEEAESDDLAFSGHGTQAAFFDFDRDGDLDCFLLNHAVTYSDDYKSIAARKTVDEKSGGKLLRNDIPHPGPLLKERVTHAQSLLVRDSTRGFESLQSEPAQLGKTPPLEGLGEAGLRTFTDVTLSAGIYCASNEYGLGIAIADLNNDGWPDIYVSNDFKEADFCYLNNRDGTFSEKGSELFAHMSRFSMGNDIADYNNDGWPDVFTLDMLSQDETVLKTSLADDDIETYNYKHGNFGFHYQFSKNCLQKNMAGAAFCDVGLQSGVAATDWSWSPLLADFNNDGNKDLFVSNGFRYRTNDLDFTAFSQVRMMQDAKLAGSRATQDLLHYLPAGDVPDYFYLGKGDEGFSDASAAAGFTTPTLSNGAAYADLDNDGDLDLIVNRMNGEAGVYRNDFSSANYLSLSLKGSRGNTFGIGTKVYAYAAGQMQCVHQSPTRGFLSSVSPVLHFGFGKNITVDSLVVCWPDGSGQRLQNVKCNQRLVLKQSDATKNFLPPVLVNNIIQDWKDATDSSGISFVHHEDEFDDLNVQPLLPHSLATQGPKFAVGDVNADGLEDFYAGGAKSQTGVLYTQKRDGKFIQSIQPAFAADSIYEDTDALFFDADGDKDLDLYVCSGGNEYFGHDAHLPDRLYTNDGHGNFTRSNNLPELYENKSCVRACDFDKDGDLDLFVGGRANARMFGYTPASVILQNNGGKFTEFTASTSNGLSNVGMVTDACWADVNSDGWMDLIVVGEWMPVTVFINQKGRLVKNDALQTSTGLWQCILPTDVDGDGNTDFLLGNWGANTKLTASENYPLKLYIHDWDGNGETEPLMATAKNDNYYSFYGKADLERRLPFLKKRFLKYTDFAGKTVEEIFTPAALNKARLLQATELKSCLLRNQNGKLVLKELPPFLQSAPVFSFVQLPDEEEQKTFMAAGNFYEVSPYEGRYDALLPVRFSFNNNNAVMRGCLLLQGPVRKLAAINTSHGKALLVSINNDALHLYKQQKP